MVSFHRTKHTHHASVGRKADVIVAALSVSQIYVCCFDLIWGRSRLREEEDLHRWGHLCVALALWRYMTGTVTADGIGNDLS
jgi:hypothetical protein